MRQWHDLIKKILQQGEVKMSRAGETISIFGAHAVFPSVSTSFPLVTTKCLAWKQAFREMACFIRGHHSVNAFHALGCNIWDANAAAWADHAKFLGDMGRIYGVQWRDWGGPGRGFDQLSWLVNEIKANPMSRRLLVTAWNPSDMDDMCLPPCPVMFQVVISEQKLHMQVYQRSADVFLGLPFDFAGYALLQSLIAKETNYRAGKLIFAIGDAHIYTNHLKAITTVLSRKPLGAPVLDLVDETLFDFNPENVVISGYAPHPPVKGVLNV